MLSKWQASVMLLISTAFAAFEIWNFQSPVPRDTLEVLVTAVFALLAVLFGGTKVFQAFKYDIHPGKVQSLKKR